MSLCWLLIRCPSPRTSVSSSRRGDREGTERGPRRVLCAAIPSGTVRLTLRVPWHWASVHGSCCVAGVTCGALAAVTGRWRSRGDCTRADFVHRDGMVQRGDDGGSGALSSPPSARRGSGALSPAPLPLGATAAQVSARLGAWLVCGILHRVDLKSGQAGAAAQARREPARGTPSQGFNPPAPNPEPACTGTGFPLR